MTLSGAIDGLKRTRTGTEPEHLDLGSTIVERTIPACVVRMEVDRVSPPTPSHSLRSCSIIVGWLRGLRAQLTVRRDRKVSS